MYETTGGVFNAGTPVPGTVAVGSAVLRWTDCAHAQLVYAFNAGSNAGRNGTIALARTGATPSGCFSP